LNWGWGGAAPPAIGMAPVITLHRGAQVFSAGALVRDVVALADPL
jgi:hypothetical protein